MSYQLNYTQKADRRGKVQHHATNGNFRTLTDLHVRASVRIRIHVNVNVKTPTLILQNLQPRDLHHHLVAHSGGAVVGAVFVRLGQHRLLVETARGLHDRLQHRRLDRRVGVVQVHEQLLQRVVDGGAAEAPGVGGALEEHD
jgi:hypothetical protein